MANQLLGFQTFREPVQPPAPVGAEHQPFTPPPEREAVLDSIVNTLTGTTSPDPAVARGEVNLAEYDVQGGTGQGFPFQQGGELTIPGEQAEAIEPSVVGLADVAAGGVPALARAAGPPLLKGLAGVAPEVADVGAQALTGGLARVQPTLSMVPPEEALKRATIPPAEPGQISTRYPTAVKAKEDPNSHALMTGIDALRAEPKVLDHNVKLMTGYDNYRKTGARGAENKAEQLIQHEVDNLLWLHDSTPEAIRERSRKWYDGANKIANEAAERHGISPQSASAVYAALSPQKDWFMNVSLGDRVMEIMTNQRNHGWSPEMGTMLETKFPTGKSVINDVLAQSIKGKRLADLDDPYEQAMWLRVFDETYNPRTHRVIAPEGDYGDIVMGQSGQPKGTGWGSLAEISSAVDVLNNPSIENISRQMGGQHKVRNFYNNILAPNSPRGEVTIDTHAVAAGLLQPFSGKDAAVLHNFGSGLKGKGGTKNSAFTGNKGTYGIHAEAYRRAAEQRGILPREMQSITWEGVRGLFSNKTAKVKKEASDIWKRYKAGEIEQNVAQQLIYSLAGGIDAPSWH